MINQDAKVTPVPADVIAKATDLANQIKTILEPYMYALLPKQRQVLPKMKDKTIAFVSKALDYAKTNSQFVPPYLDLETLAQDIETVTDLTQIENPIASMSLQLNDTTMLAGSEAYVAALTFYNSVKEAARRNVPGAKAIFEDLKIRFEQTHKDDTPGK